MSIPLIPLGIHRKQLLIAAAVVISALATGLANASDRWRSSEQKGTGSTEVVLPGEFEHQDAILLSWESDDRSVQQTVLSMIRAVHRFVPVILLVGDRAEHSLAERALEHAGLSRADVNLLRLRFDTVWVRDYGPMVVRLRDGTLRIADPVYDRETRPKDDSVPPALADVLGLETVEVPIRIEGGNLISNGNGLCLTTTKTVVFNRQNKRAAPTELHNLFRKHFGARKLVLLEPLVGELTGHVDMFATFTDEQTVVVGWYSPEVDPVNAAVLNRNADRLARVETPRGPLRVVRIPMPPREGNVWRTYTNVLYANGVVLMPSYAGVNRRLEAIALETYKRLLPDRRIIPIDCTDVIALGGAIHCISMNLNGILKTPESRQKFSNAREDIREDSTTTAHQTFSGAAPFDDENRTADPVNHGARDLEWKPPSEQRQAETGEEANGSFASTRVPTFAAD